MLILLVLRVCGCCCNGGRAACGTCKIGVIVGKFLTNPTFKTGKYVCVLVSLVMCLRLRLQWQEGSGQHRKVGY
jgi:hypothetical protein